MFFLGGGGKSGKHLINDKIKKSTKFQNHFT